MLTVTRVPLNYSKFIPSKQTAIFLSLQGIFTFQNPLRTDAQGQYWTASVNKEVIFLPQKVSYGRVIAR